MGARDSPRRVFIGLCVGLALLGSVPAVATAAAPTEPEPPCAHYTEHGFDVNVSATLWSKDSDAANMSREAYRNRCGHERTPRAYVAGRFDYLFTVPPAAVERWTTAEFDEWPGQWEADGNESVAPSGAETVDAGTIRDAHASIFGISPSTQFHYREGTTTLYVGSEATVYGTQDFRVGYPQANTTGPNQTTVELVEHRVRATCLLQGNYSAQAGVEGADPCATAPELRVLDRGNGHRSQLSLADLESPSQVSYVAVFEATVEVTDRTCERWNETRQECTGNWSESREEVETTVPAVDATLVAPYDAPSVDLRAAQFPNGSVAIVAETGSPIAGIDIPTGDGTTERLVWNWRLLSARDPGWDRLTTRTATTSETVHSPLHPLQVHAYPSKQRIKHGSTVTVLGYEGRERPAPTLSDSIRLRVPNGTYEEAVRIHARYEGSPSELNDTTVIGLVAGENASAVDVEPVKTVDRSHLDARVVGGNESTIRVRARLTAVDGTPIDTRGRGGYLSVGGERVQTNATGVATITIPRRTYATVTYHPAGWRSTSDPFVGNETVVTARPADPSGMVLQAVVELAVLAFPIVFVVGMLRLGGGFQRDSPE